jgi:hypothetical protein
MLQHIETINNTFKELGIKKVFTLKKGKNFGIKGTSNFDNKSLNKALYSFVMQEAYNQRLYDRLLEFNLVPKFQIGDLVCWKLNYDSTKKEHEVDYKRIDVITNINIDIFGEYNYYTKETNNVNGEPKLGKAFTNYLVKVGVSNDIEFTLLGKEKDFLSQMDGNRLSSMLDANVINKILAPTNHKFYNDSSTSTFGGYSYLNYSIYLRLIDTDDKNMDQFKGEIRIHYRKTAGNQLSATLWLNRGGIYYGQFTDLFDKYKDVARFIYADTYDELFKKIVDTLNTIFEKENAYTYGYTATKMIESNGTFIPTDTEYRINANSEDDALNQINSKISNCSWDINLMSIKPWTQTTI